MITDEDLKTLIDLNIIKLTIERTRITDTGLLYLAENQSLKLICIDDTAITEEGRKKFKKLSPDCQLSTWKELRGTEAFQETNK